MIRTAKALLIVFVSQLLATALSAQTRSEVATGKMLVQKNCSRCHAIGSTDRSKHPAAPPFVHIFRRYPASILAEAFAEGLSTGHPDMPEFTFEPRETAAIIRYLESISEQTR